MTRQKKVLDNKANMQNKRGITQRPSSDGANGGMELGVAKAVTYMCRNVTRMPGGRTRSSKVPWCREREGA